MKKKFMVVSVSSSGVKKAKCYETFDEARTALRKQILCPEGIVHVAEQIKAYAQEIYPENTPVAFSQLANILTKLATDPDYPQFPADMVLEEFDDGNVEFYLDEYARIVINVFNDIYDQKFPSARIDVVKIYDPEQEYYFFLKDKMWTPDWYWDVSMKPVTVKTIKAKVKH